MSILSAASNASAWRGYEYYTQKKVAVFTKISDNEYEGRVVGTGVEPYRVMINTAKVRQSKCDCPHANGTKIICKHMVALFFEAFPSEAEKYIVEVEEYEKEEEKRMQERYSAIKTYVNSLSKEELREELFRALLELEQGSHYW